MTDREAITILQNDRFVAYQMGKGDRVEALSRAIDALAMRASQEDDGK